MSIDRKNYTVHLKDLSKLNENELKDLIFFEHDKKLLGMEKTEANKVLALHNAGMV